VSVNILGSAVAGAPVYAEEKIGTGKLMEFLKYVEPSDVKTEAIRWARGTFFSLLRLREASEVLDILLSMGEICTSL